MGNGCWFCGTARASYTSSRNTQSRTSSSGTYQSRSGTPWKPNDAYTSEPLDMKAALVMAITSMSASERA